jgi:hypothetical protein
MPETDTTAAAPAEAKAPKSRRAKLTEASGQAPAAAPAEAKPEDVAEETVFEAASAEPEEVLARVWRCCVVGDSLIPAAEVKAVNGDPIDCATARKLYMSHQGIISTPHPIECLPVTE